MPRERLLVVPRPCQRDVAGQFRHIPLAGKLLVEAAYLPSVGVCAVILFDLGSGLLVELPRRPLRDREPDEDRFLRKNRHRIISLGWGLEHQVVVFGLVVHSQNAGVSDCRLILGAKIFKE